MKKLIKFMAVLLLLMGDIIPVYAEDVVKVEIPVEVIGGGEVEISGERNLPSETIVHNSGKFEITYENASPGDVFVYTIKQTNTNKPGVIYDTAEYQCYVYIAYEQGTNKLYAVAVLQEGDETTKPIEIKFENKLKKGNVLVVYKDEDGKVLKEIEYVIKNGDIGTKYSTEELEFKDYEFSRMDDLSAPREGTVKEEDQTVIYIYKKKKEGPKPEKKYGNVLVEYKVDGTNEVLKELEYVIKNGEIDEEYITKLLEFEGYEFVRVEGEPSGKVVEGDTVITYYYRKKPEVVEKRGNVDVIYKVEGTGEVLKNLEWVIHQGLLGTEYSTKQLQFDGYEFVRMDSSSAPASGKVEEYDQHVIYLYKKKVNPPVIDKVVEPVREFVNTSSGASLIFSSCILALAIISITKLRKQNKA